VALNYNKISRMLPFKQSDSQRKQSLAKCPNLRKLQGVSPRGRPYRNFDASKRWPISRTEAMAILTRDNEGFHHLGVNEVAVELVEFV